MSGNTDVKVLSPFDLFWHSQNQKLIANPEFLDGLGDLYDEVLNFKHYGGGKTALDFSLFDLEHLCLEDVATLEIDGLAFKLTFKEYAKLAVINNISLRSIRGALPAFQMMLHIAAFLKTNSAHYLDLRNIESFHVSFLTQSISEKGWSTRLSPPSFNATYNNFDIIKLRQNLHAINVKGVIDSKLMKRHFLNTLDSACRSIFAISRNEYQKGGSFNSLSLEVGQYYVDHLKSIHENDYLFSYVCQSALHATVEHFGVLSSKENSAISETILDTYVYEEKNKHNGKDKVHKFLKSMLFSEYERCVSKISSLKIANLCKLVEELGLALRFDGVEVVRALMLMKYYSFDSSDSPETVWRNYLMSLSKTEVQSQALEELTAKDVYQRMSNIVATQRMEKVEFKSSLTEWANRISGNSTRKSFVDLKRAFARLNDAMTTLMVAYLGYRKSEFGFPLKAIRAESNLDVLDSAHIPFRFKLVWYVPKTNGTTKVSREITSQCYQLSAQINDLHQGEEDSPCLYADARKNVATSYDSTIYISNKVKSNWRDFVENYRPFTDISELQRLNSSNKAELTEQGKARLFQLRKQYDLNSDRVNHLITTHKKLKHDIKLLQCTSFAGDKSQKRFKLSLIEFQETGSISDKQHSDVVSFYLSDDTKRWLRSEATLLNAKSMLDIANELLTDVRYPTPHSFRHIWAESVLMRYQGDVGAVIRHQFCHLNESFFMSYLRDKEAKNIMQAARMRVLNSIVDKMVSESEKSGSEYVGGFSQFVKKAVSLTKPLTKKDRRLLRDRISGRVISIQPSRFATCAPREGAEIRAKCAQMGHINPQDAKPSFCLNCSYAIITNGNIQGIWITIQPFVKECLNTEILGIMVESHLPTLRSAYSRIKLLAHNSQDDNVIKILSLINKAINSVEHRLKNEGYSYV